MLSDIVENNQNHIPKSHLFCQTVVNAFLFSSEEILTVLNKNNNAISPIMYDKTNVLLHKNINDEYFENFQTINAY